jgi:hypothetical protein
MLRPWDGVRGRREDAAVLLPLQADEPVRVVVDNGWGDLEPWAAVATIAAALIGVAALVAAVIAARQAAKAARDAAEACD